MQDFGRNLLSSILWSFGLVISLVLMTTVTAQARKAHLKAEDLGALQFGGHIHSIATSLDQDFQNGNSADTGAVDVNSLELGITSSPLVPVDASTVFLMEEGLDNGSAGQDIDVDQAFVTIAGNNRVLKGHKNREEYDVTPWYAKVGKFYSPFGTQMEYHTFDVISEPQTLALAETLESSFQLGYTPSDQLNLYAGAFSGAGADSEGGSGADENLDDIFVGADVERDFGRLSVQWTNNINNSIALGEDGEINNASDDNSGLSLYGQISHNNWNLQAAWVGALNEYDRGNHADSTPTATTVELTYSGVGELWNRPVSGTLVYEQTDEWQDHPDEIWGAVVDMPVYRGVTGSVEYITRDYDSNLSSGLDDENLISFRMAVEFSDLISTK